MPSRVARLRLAQAVETQFDTSIVAAFEAILAGVNEDYRTAKGAAFMLDRRELEDDTSDVEVVNNDCDDCLGDSRKASHGFTSGSNTELFEDVTNMDLDRRE